ncbi:hypothetical protein HYT05_01835 [Candidatus Kaiserbacteria bacterium]|nr:hypothetical protein [Candidatus Kaiserbacteria bacterium]
MFEFNEKVIDLNVNNIDTTHPGDGVVTIVNNIPTYILVGVLSIVIIVSLFFFFRRMRDLHENVLKSQVRMPLSATRRAVGRAAGKFAERAKALAEGASDPAEITVMQQMHEYLCQVGSYPAIPRLERSLLICGIERASRTLMHRKPVEVVKRSEGFSRALVDMANLTKDVTDLREAQENLDSQMGGLVKEASRVPASVSEEAIIKVLDKAKVRLLRARQRCLTETYVPKPTSWRQRRKDIRAGDFKVPDTEAPLAEMLRVINETLDAISRLRPMVAMNDRDQQIARFARDVRSWLEVVVTLAYPSFWSAEAVMWFLWPFGRR